MSGATTPREGYFAPHQGRVLCIAHRGARSVAPENTILAAQRGLEEGADLWELDVQLTADGHLVVVHDDTLERTTDVASRPEYAHRAPWRVCDFTLVEVRGLDAGGWYQAADPFGQVASGGVTADDLRLFPGLRIPTLDEALAFTADHGWRVNVEIKDMTVNADGSPGSPGCPPYPGDAAVVRAVLECIRAHGLTEKVILSSFRHDYLRHAAAMQPALALAALVEDVRPADPVALCRDLGVVAYHPGDDIVTEADVAALRAMGVAVNVWTVNEEADMRRFIDWGVSGLITDFPLLCWGILREKGLA
ncbi:MAG TPA: glycerophosphodiester phosphodiesterase [Desulfovibrio sp.]|jgi:glycerophosphoryl diester phosphodiesterase|nr:glycerophosphodiester phosphodiesterase [Desulfovibrio sp.]